MTATGSRAGTAARYVWIGSAIALLTLLTFLQFPGHTWLHSDTQIYFPILERYWDHTAFARDLLARYPHVSFTVYDEAALALRRLTGLDFEGVLVLQQFVFRGLGILGVFLLAAAMRLSPRMALLVAAAFSLGAFIAGPQVLTIELEPVPRGSAISLLLFAVGLAAHGRDFGAGLAIALAFLYHAPSVIPFWMVYFCLTLWPSKPAVMGRRIWGLAPILAGVLILSVLSRTQAGILEPQTFFSRIAPDLEQIQRARAPYNWVSTWAPEWSWHYVFLWAVSLAAFWRVRRWASQDVRFFLVGLPLIGALSVPVSYLLLEKWKWIVVPQVQPARAILFVTAMAGILAAIAAVKAGEQRRYWESALWFLLVFAIPANTRVLGLLAGLRWPYVRQCALAVLGLALLAALAVWAESGKRKWAALPWAAALLVPFFLIPAYGNKTDFPAYARMKTDPSLDDPELRALAAWARSATPRDAVFLFPDAGRQLYPGFFRAESLRAVYVDWKGGGQVNFLSNFAHEWWARWQRVGAGRFFPEQVTSYPAFGIDYFVLKKAHRLAGRAPVFENSGFLVYRP